MVLAVAMKLNLNTRYSSAVAQRALLVFEINLEYVIDIIIIINNNILSIIIAILKAISTMNIINKVSPACSVCQS